MNNYPFTIHKKSSSPKYRQIIDGVISAIERKELLRNDVLPTVSQLCKQFSLSRDTVVKAYSALKRKGIIKSIPRKGYYVATESVKHKIKVFLLFDAFTPYKQELYDWFIKSLGVGVSVDIFFHHFNIDIFESLILDNIGKYGRYVIMPYPHGRIPEILEKIESTQLLILDRCCHLKYNERNKPITAHSYVRQDFKIALYQSLLSGFSLFRKYREIVLVFPIPSMHPREIMDGFTSFCEDNGLIYEIIHNLKKEKIEKNKAYFVIDDLDLVFIVEKCRDKNYALGDDVGVISYNDTSMKRIVGNGISVISIDWKKMGEKTGQFILNPEKTQVQIPTKLITRSSL
jgi:DNA-binding transcriptional regulator YhcF (GntR family)